MHPSLSQILNERAIWLRSSAYVVISMVYRALGLLLVPLTVGLLTAEEFSRYGLMSSVIVLLTYALSFNIHVAPGRLFFDYDDQNEQSMLLSTTLLAASGLALLGLLAILGFIKLNGIEDPISTGSIDIQVLIALAILSTVWFQFSVTVMRIEGNVVYYGAVHILQRVVLIGGFIALHFLMTDTFRALVIAYSCSTLLSGAGGIYHCRSHLNIDRLSRRILRVAIRFSAPTTVHAVALWAVMSSGRWIGALYMSLEDLAPYTLVTLFFGLVSMFPRALFEARVPAIGTTFAKRNYTEGRRIINVTVLASVFITLSIYAVTFVLLFLFGVRLPDAYMPTPLLIVFASAANVFDTIYLRGIQILTATKRTGTQAMVTILSGLLTVVGSFFLVSAYGDSGLVAAFTGGLFVQALGANIVAQQSL